MISLRELIVANALAIVLGFVITWLGMVTLCNPVIQAGLLFLALGIPVFFGGGSGPRR